MRLQVDISHYRFQKYVGRDRWASYWHQIYEVLSAKPNSVLVVGVGDGIVSGILAKYISVKTVDIDVKLKPDVVASVTELPLGDTAFDLVLCAQVLEHIPFENFERALLELKRVAKKRVIISLPHFSPQVKVKFKVPYLPEVQFAFKIPFPIKHVFNGEHYWEIGKREYSAGRIKKIIRQYFKIEREFIPFDNQYHHFYILERQ